MRKAMSVIFAIFLMVGLFCSEPSWVPVRAVLVSPPVPTGFWATIRAYDLRVAYWTGIEPHYGAFFQGAWGRDQHYLGPGGDASTCGSSSGCIWSWNWWGDWGAVLLVPKRGWLWAEPPGGPRWQPANYQATLWIG